MGIYIREDSPYWWKKYEIDHRSGKRPRTPASTKIYHGKLKPYGLLSEDVQKENRAAAVEQYQRDCIAIREGVTETPAPVETPTITLRAWADEYIRDTIVPTHRAFESTTYVINGIVDDLGPDLLLTDVTIARVKAWRTMRLKTVKASTVNRGITVLSPMLDAAVPLYLPSNPLAELKEIRKDETETLPFTREQWDSFIATIQAHDDILGTPKIEGLALAYTAKHTLLRRSSLAKLTWANYRTTHFVPKNAKVKITYSPITPHMREYIDQLPRDTPDGRIFASHDRVGLTRWSAAAPAAATYTAAERLKSICAHITKWAKEVCRLADIPWGRDNNGVVFHSFRHTGATEALKRNGGNVKAVMKLGGWKNAQLFIDTYCHAEQAEVDAAAAGIDGDPRKPGIALVK